MTTERSSPPNVIVFFTDQQRWDTIGYAGNPHIHTPNLDRLAREGVHFTHAYTTQGQCVPSRAVFQSCSKVAS